MTRSRLSAMLAASALLTAGLVAAPATEPAVALSGSIVRHAYSTANNVSSARIRLTLMNGSTVLLPQRQERARVNRVCPWSSSYRLRYTYETNAAVWVSRGACVRLTKNGYYRFIQYVAVS